MFFFLLPLAAISLIFLLLSKNRRRNTPPFHPPPGPKGLPLIRNLHQFDPLKPHICLAKLGKIYGPILSLRLGSVPVFVVQSAKIAKEVLQTQDLNFCSRPSMVGTRRLSYDGLDITFNPYNEYSREIRKLCTVHLFSSKKVQSFSPIREDEVSKMIEKVCSLSSAPETINMSELLMNYSSSNISRIAFGKRYGDDDEPERRKFYRLLNEAQALFTAFFFSDYFPAFGWIDKLDGQASRLERAFRELDAFYEEIIKDHLDPRKAKSQEVDLVDTLLNIMNDSSFTCDLTLDNIKAVLMNVIVAGTDTSAAMVVWAMTELVKNPNAMRKVQEELRNAARNKGYITEGDITNLEYFKAVVKETFRIHPGAPLLIVRETLRKCTIEGYEVLPKTLAFVNVWAIGRDPECWRDPETFTPERFLGSSINFKGQDFELLPFGAGRRMCPGMLLGVANSELALAKLLYSFDWELPIGVKKEDIDTDTLPGITMHKKNPLCLVAKKFSGNLIYTPCFPSSFHPPPGPKGLPLIGNLHQFDPLKPHICLAKLGKIYGPILSLRLGSVPVVVVQSAKIAKEVLQTQDLNFCSRPSMVGAKRLSYNGLDITFNPYNEYSREIRKLCTVHLFSSKKVQSFSLICEDEVSKMIEKISSFSSASDSINLSDMLLSYTSSNISRIVFGKRYGDEEESERRKFSRLLKEAQALLVAFFFSDYFPSIGWIDKLTGQASRLERAFKEMEALYDEIIKDHLDPNKPKSQEEDLIDTLIRLMNDRSFTIDLTLDNIKAVLMNVIVAGTDTGAAMGVWAMTELVQNPNVMRKVQEELRNAAGNKGQITNGDLANLVYFKAVVKETFRIHPGAPLLIVRETLRKCTIEGYEILPKTLAFINVWAIGRNPKCWRDPETFAPERFLGSSINFKGQDFELLPFGAGRRMCPGMHLGVATSEFALANLLYSFDWELPIGVKKEDIDTDTLPGITMHKKIPLCVVAKKFSGNL